MAARQGRSRPDPAVSDDRARGPARDSVRWGPPRGLGAAVAPRCGLGSAAPTFGRVRGRALGGRGGFQQNPEENSSGPEAAAAEGLGREAALAAAHAGARSHRTRSRRGPGRAGLWLRPRPPRLEESPTERIRLVGPPGGCPSRGPSRHSRDAMDLALAREGTAWLAVLLTPKS